MESLVHILVGNALAATVLAVVAAGAGRAIRRPAVTHSLWLLVLLKLLTPPLVPVAFPVADTILAATSSAGGSQVERDFEPAALAELSTDETDRALNARDDFSEPSVNLFDVAPEVLGAGEVRPSTDLPDYETHLVFSLLQGWTWKRVAPIVILSGALSFWVLAAVRIFLFQRVLRDVEPAPPELQSHTNLLAERLGLGHRPAVCLVPGRLPPMVWAFGGRARLLVPSELWAAMAEDERTSLLLHELAHLKRRDHWVRWLELVVAGFYWWHPVTWWARRGLREAEEQCCDAWVVWAMPRQARTYAAALMAAVEFVSGARTAPAVASATSGSGHVSCLKRRLRMIVRAKTPKGLSWAGRIAVLGMAAVLLPLAPGWAQNEELTRADSNSRDEANEARQSKQTPRNGEAVEKDDRVDENRPVFARLLEDDLKQVVSEQAGVNADRELDALIKQLFMNDPDVEGMRKAIAAEREQLDHARQMARQPQDPALVAARKAVEIAEQQYSTLWERKYREILDRLTHPSEEAWRKRVHDHLLAMRQDDDKPKEAKERIEKDADDIKEKARDAAERFQEQLTDLIGKIGKQFNPVTEEIRKALDRAVGEVHKSLDRENLSVEDLGKALEKSQEELMRAFEGGGPVDKELRDAIEKSRKELEGAIDRGKSEVQDHVDTFRARSRDLADQARESLERAKASAEKDVPNDGEQFQNRQELENARREIRELEQQLRRSTRRLEDLQRRELRRAPGPRRERIPREATRPAVPAAPGGEATEPGPARERATPATPARPARPEMRRPQLPGRPGAGGLRRGAQGTDNEKRILDLEEKMKSLLKELEQLKQEKPTTD